MSSFRLSRPKTIIASATPPGLPPSQDTQILSNVNGTNQFTYPGYNYNGNNYIPNGNLDVSSIVNLPVTTSSLKYIGSVMTPNGLIYSFPGLESNVLIVDPYTNTYNRTTIRDISTSVYPVIGSSSSDKWTGGVVSTNFIYGIPQASKAIMKINWTNNALSFIDISNLATATYNWYGGVLAPNGNIYGIPHGASTVLRLNPVNDAATAITISGPLVGSYYYTGGVLAPNGNIYGIPHDASSCLVIDTSNNTARTDISGLGNLGTTSGKWLCGVLGQDGKIYGIPFVSNNVLVIDPSSNTTTQIATGLTGPNKYYGGVLAEDGKIYCCPHRATSILVIDTTRNPAVVSTIPNANSQNDWWSGSTLASNGKIYLIPGRSNNVAILKTSLPVYSNWMMAPQFNKF
jgi:hypothetical protein